MDALNSIELTLKTPNQRVNDIRLKCGEDWTIRNLKEHLQDVYPSKPVSYFQQQQKKRNETNDEMKQSS